MECPLSGDKQKRRGPRELPTTNSVRIMLDLECRLMSVKLTVSLPPRRVDSTYEYEGALPNAALMKGLRLRSGNVQVGEHALLEELFSEPRFNVWSVGEVHVIDRRIVPNGRRDHFEQNAHFHNLLNHLAPTAREISRRCRTSSIRRKCLREFESQRLATVDAIKIIKQRSVGKAELARFAHSGERCLLQMERSPR
jgi:hypothetical protein